MVGGIRILMNYCLTKISLIFTMLGLVNFSIAAGNEQIQLYDKGLDGNVRIYSVGCPNGKKTSIAHMLSDYGEAERSGIAKQNTKDELNVVIEPEEDAVSSDENDDEIPESSESSSVSQTAANIKQKFLKLIGQDARAEVCLYPANGVAQCKSYQSIDIAAKAACNLIN